MRNGQANDVLHATPRFALLRAQALGRGVCEQKRWAVGMRSFTHLVALFLAVVTAGCGSQARRRADYLRATLPYDATMAVSAAVVLRQENPNSKALGFLDEAICFDLLRLKICLSDPDVPEKDKTFARHAFQKLTTYAALYDVAKGFKPGHVYPTPAGDLALPPRIAIRDAVEEVIAGQKMAQPDGPANGSQPIRSETNRTPLAAGSRR
jgi:hypothetical protein